MKNNIKLGEKAYTKIELIFKGHIIPINTLAEIIETNCGENSEEFKVYFKCEPEEHEENIQVINKEEIKEWFK